MGPFTYVIVLCLAPLATVESASPLVSIATTPVSVSESTATGTASLLGTSCTSSDADGALTSSGTYYMDISGGNSENKFVVVGNTCNVYLVRTLDYETTTSYSLTVRATDLDSNTGTSNLVVNVADANDNAPACSPGVVVGSLAETSAAGTQFYDLSLGCSDPDTGTGAQFEYTVVSGDTTFIDVGQTTGLATVKTGATLDYETAQTHSVVVRLVDKGTPAYTSSATVYLSVTDTDDNIPSFNDGTTYTGSVNENSALGTTIHTLQTTDADSGDNAKVTYAFSGTPSPDWIKIDPVSGALIVKDTIDYETSSTITCTVTAYSSTQTGSTDSIAVTINVVNTNDNTPSFASTFYDVSVAENAAFGAVVTTILATDADTTDTVAMTLTDSSNTFTMASSTGVITLALGLDYETTPGFLLKVTASDGTNTQDVYLRIQVTPINEITPSFSPFAHTGTYGFSVSEDTALGTSVTNCQLTVSDTDSGDDGVIQYKVTTSGSKFATDLDTGVLRVITALDYETATTEVFVVEAYDKSGTSPLTATATYTASITDVNDVNIPCNTESTKYIPDPTSLGYIVTTLVCTDVDTPTNALAYSISSQVALPSNTAVTTFTMNSASPDLLMSTAPAYTRFLVTIAVTDTVDTTSVEVYVVTETQFALNTITSQTITEGDVGNTIWTFTWSEVYPFVQIAITSGNSDNKVILYRTSGALMLISPYDRETASSYSYAVSASTTSNQVATGTLTVTVDDINDNTPAFGSNIYFVNIAETLATNTVIGTYSATDADSSTFGPITHSVFSGDTTTFSYDSSTGVLTLISTLDYETTTSYTFVLYAADAGTPSIAQQPLTGSTTVVLTVTNVDDNAASITLEVGSASITLAEDNALGSTIARVKASDSDTGIAFTYSIDSGNTNNDFMIDPVTGNVTQVNLLDRETTASYTMVLKATDQNSATITSTVTVTVTDINDNDPTFSQPVYTFTIPHNTASGVSVGDVAVSDADDASTVNGQMTTIIDDGGVTGIFTLSTLQIQTATTMDYSATNQYDFTMKVSDGATTARTATCRVIVYVAPATTEPKFNPTSATVTVTEGQFAGFQVYDLDATVYGASETDNTMKYEIVTATPTGGFTVVSDTGEVVLAASPDYETTTSFVLTIKACIIADCTNLVDTFTLTVTVLDTNDNIPYFNAESYSYTVAETQSVSYQVGSITAIDNDASAPYNTLTYALSGDATATTKFTLVDSTNGVIQLSQTLDYATWRTGQLVLTASDGGSPALSAVVTIVINIEDKNTNTPVFTTSNTMTVLDSSPIGSEVFHVHATDADTGTAGTLSYAILSDTSNGVFSINSTTGIMTTNSLMDGAIIGSYTLVLQVEDGGNDAIRSATQTLSVTITSTSPNYNDPVFTAATANVITVSLARAATVGTTVATALATDTDNSNSGVVVHKLTSGNTQGYFIIDSATGVITTIASVAIADDYYTLIVTAKDKGVPQRSASVTVSINLDTPKTTFETFDYSFTIDEDTASSTEVGKIEVDTGRTITGSYAISLGNFHNTFQIAKDASDSRGILSVLTPPNFEVKANYSLQVTVGTDIGTAYKFVQVVINDKNDCPPLFDQSSYTLTLPEGTPVGTTLFQLPFTDCDTASVNLNNIVEVDSQGSQLFSVDQTGILTISTMPDYETSLTSFQFSVTVREGNSPFNTATSIVSVTILDLSEEYTSYIANRDPMHSLECPYPAEDGDVLRTFNQGGSLYADANNFAFDTTNLESVEWYTIPIADDPFTIDSSTGVLSVLDASKLEVDKQYVRWVIAKGSYSDGTVVPKYALVRIDTFQKYDHMIVMEMENTQSYTDGVLNNFQTRTQFFFTYPELLHYWPVTYDITTTTTTSRRKLLSTSKTAVYFYSLANRGKDWRANINTAATFMTAAEMLALLQSNEDGTQVNGLDASGLTVIKVAPFASCSTCNGTSSIASLDTFWQTMTGTIILCLLITFIALLAGIVIFCVILNRLKQEKLRPPKEDLTPIEPEPDTVSIISVEQVETKRWNAQRWDFMDHLVYKKK